MSEQAQLGDTVRLTITRTYQGVVEKGWENLCVNGMNLSGGLDDRTVEILSRAIPPLPSEPGTWWLDRYDDVWQVDACGDLHSNKEDNLFVAIHYAPFRQLVLK